MVKEIKNTRGRPATNYKAKYVEMMKQNNILMKAKLEKLSKDDDKELYLKDSVSIDKTKKEVMEAPQPRLNSLKSSGASDLLKVEENLIETPKKFFNELEVYEEETKKAIKINPDDYEFRCSNCRELFNSTGNISRVGWVRCPDCQKEYKI